MTDILDKKIREEYWNKQQTGVTTGDIDTNTMIPIWLVCIK